MLALCLVLLGPAAGVGDEPAAPTLPPPAVDPHSETLAAARQALQGGELDAAIEALEAFQRTARDSAAADQLRRAGEWLDEAHTRRTSEWVEALERREADHGEAFVFGRRLVNSRRLDDALRLLVPLVAQIPDDPQAQYWLGQAYLHTRRFDEALEHLERSVALAPDNLALRLELGRARAIAGDAEQAERIFTEIATTAPDAATAAEARRQLELVRDEGNLLRRAMAMEEAGRPDRAERLYRRLIADDETGDASGAEALEADFRLGRLWLQRGNLDEAIDTLERYRQQARQHAPPERLREADALLDAAYEQRAAHWATQLGEGEPDTDAAFVFGRRLVNIGRHALAMQVLAPLVVRLPDDPQARYWLGTAHLREAQFESALEHLERSVALDPDNVALRLELGRAYEQAGARTRAEQTFLDIDERAPETPMAREARRRLDLGRAERLIEVSDWAGALAIYQRLLAEHPDDPRLLDLKSGVLEQLGRDDELDRVLQQRVAQSPRDVDVLLRSAASFERRGRGAPAQQLYIRILGLQADGEAARFALGRLGFAQGVELIRTGRYDEALVFFERLQTVAPRSPLVNLNLGIAHHGLQRLDDAEAAYRRALEQDPNNLGAWLQLGQVLEDSGRHGEAIEAIEVALGLARTPQQGEVVRLRLRDLYAREVDRLLDAVGQDEVAVEALVSDAVVLGRTLFQRRFDDQAVRLLSPLLTLAPDDPQLHFWLGRSLLRSGESDAGVAAIERSVELAPDNLLLQAELGQSLLQIERWADAERVFEGIATRSPEAGLRRQAQHNQRLARARGLEAAQEHEAALAEYETLLEETPGDRPLEIRRGHMLLALGRDAPADEVFDRLLEQTPDDVALRMQLAALYQQYRRPQARERLLREVVELAPGNVQVRADLGRLYLETGRLGEGLDEYAATFERLRQMDPAEPQVVELVRSLTEQMIRLGRGLTADGLFDEAEQVLERLVEIQPRNSQALYWLSQLHHEQGDHRREAELLEAVVELTPGNVLMERRLGLAHADARDHDQAVAALGAVLATFPFDSEVRFRLAEVHRQRGEQEQAEAELARLLELNPPDEWRLQALDRLGLGEVEQHLDRNEPEQALAILPRLLERAPDEAPVVLALARAYHQAGRGDEAEAMYRQALELAQDDSRSRLGARLGARLGLARLHADSDREAEAIAIWFAVATDDPLLAEAVEARAALDDILQRRARRELAAAAAITDPADLEQRLLPVAIEMVELDGHDAALALLEPLAVRAPDSAPVHYWLGRTYMASERHADAIVVLRHSTELDADAPRYRVALARAYQAEGLLRLAEETFGQARALAPDDLAILFDLADLHEQRGDRVSAVDALVQVFERSPDDAMIERALARLAASDPERAPELSADSLWELLGSLPAGRLEAVAANHYMARLYRQQQRPAEAEAAWRAVLASDPTHAGAGLGLARLYHDSGRPDEALALLAPIAEGPGDEQVRQAARALVVTILSARAETLAERLPRDEAEASQAVALGQELIRYQAFDEAATLLEAAAAQAPADAQVFYWLGRAHRFSGRTGPALSALARSAALAPGNLLLSLELGIVYQEAGQLEQAVTLFDEVAMQTDDAGLHRDARKRAGQARAQQFARAGHPAAALREIEALLPDHPRDVVLLGERGRLLLLLDQVDEADRTFARILEIAPQNIGVRMRLAGIYRSRGETVRYLEQLAAVIALAPASAEAAAARAQLGYARGLALIDEEDPAGAQEVFERMLTVVPDDALTRFQLARAYQQQGRIGEAEMQLTRVVELDPSHQQALAMLGGLYELLERQDSAMQVYERAVDLDPESDEGRQALTRLAALYGARIQELVDAGRADVAIQGLRRLVDNAPGNVAARLQLARLYISEGHHEDGLAELREAVRLRPTAAAWRLKGSVYQELSQPAQTARALSQAIALEEDEGQASLLAREVVMAVARHMLSDNRPFAAIRHLQALHDAGLGSERSWFMLGAIYRQQGQHEEAVRAYREAVRLAPDNVTLRFNLAEMHQRLNDQDLALIQYRDIVRRGTPGDRIVEESRRRAEFLRDRLALFSSQLSISLVAGETVIQEQDITDTGALNSSLSSQLFYNLGTNFRPTDHMTLRLDTGFSYIGNHSSQVTSLVPRIGLVGNLDYTSLFYRASAHVSENWDMRSETHLARSYNATLSGGVRFTDPLAVFRGWGRDRHAERGERELQRAPLERPHALVGLTTDNAALRHALREIFSDQFAPVARGDLDDSGEFDAGQWLEHEETVRLSVESVMTLYREGQRLHRQGRLDAALAQYRRILDIVPDDPLVQLAAGMIHQRRQQYDEAEAAYRMAMDDEVAGRAARLRLAEVQVARDRVDEAVTLLAPMVQTATDSAEQDYLREQLQTLRSRQMVGLAFEDVYRAALDEAGLASALADIERGRFRQALATLESMAAEFPDDPLVWLNIGVAHQRLGEGIRAEAAFQRVTDLDERNLNAWLRLGMLYADSGQTAQAITLLGQVASDGAGLEIGDRAREALERLEQAQLRALAGEQQVERATPASKAVQWRLFYTDTQLPVTSLTETFSYGFGLSFNYSSIDYGNWGLNYTFGVRDNKESLGTDYAYLWHDYGVSWQTSVPNVRGLFGAAENIPGLSAVLSVNRQVREYLNVDTNALNVLGRLAHRRHVTDSLSAGLNYVLPGQERMSLSLNYSIGRSDTTLPVGIVFSPEGAPVAFQSSGLGAFDTSFVSLGLNFRF